MADNVTLGTTGAVVATDDVGGVQFPRYKVTIGADGAAVDVQPPDADGKASSVVFPAAGLVYDSGSGTWNRPRNALSASDGGTGANTPYVTTGLYNGATFDRQYNNTEATLLASAARTVTTTTANQTNRNGRGVMIVLGITVASGTGGLQIRVQGLDGFGNDAQLNASPTRIIATGRYGYVVYPGATAGVTAGNGTVNQYTDAPLPRTWRVEVNVGDASSYTYTLACCVIV